MDFWHCLNRGVDGRALFIDNRDRARFVHDLFEFNDSRQAFNAKRNFYRMGLRNPVIREERVPLVELHGWCLMKNHYHLLLSEREENGLSKFLRKLNVGYANYFNERHQRKGTLFQGRTKKIPVQTDAHYHYILHYIHLNPLDYMKGSEEWRIRSKSTINNMSRTEEYLDQYRWSSYLDYKGHHNFPSILTKDHFDASPGTYAQSLATFLKDSVDDQQMSLNLE